MEKSVPILTNRKFVESEVTEENKDFYLKSYLRLLNIKNDHKHGYLVKCDLEDPQKIFKKLNNFHFVWSNKQSKQNTFTFFSCQKSQKKINLPKKLSTSNKNKFFSKKI